MARKKTVSRKSKPNYFTRVEEACKQYGARLLVHEFYAEIVFKDGKTLTYALPVYGYGDVKDLLEGIESGFRGRVFRKNGDFIDYAPASASIDNILIAVDMMV